MGRLANLLLGPPEKRTPLLKRDVAPLEGTRMSLFNSIIPDFWATNQLGQFANSWWPGDGRLAERVWVANRCMQLNAQQIASMPLRFEAPAVSADGQPSWLSNPDPEYFPNGISDALFAIVHQLYGWGFSCQYVTNTYFDGYPRNWTVLPSSRMSITFDDDGDRVYKLGEAPLDPSRIVQIDRNPSWCAHGESALRAYAQEAWGLLAASNQSMAVAQGAMPRVYLETQRKTDAAQAALLQQKWMEKANNRNGAPPVIDPQQVVPKELSFNPSDLALLETQEWNARILATAFGVPSVILNMALQGGLTYQNPAALGEMWWRFELRPTAKRIADALTAQMLPAGQWVWFDAGDTFLPLGPTSEKDDPQESTVAPASPAQQTQPPRLSAIGGNG